MTNQKLDFNAALEAATKINNDPILVAVEIVKSAIINLSVEDFSLVFGEFGRLDVAYKDQVIFEIGAVNY